MILGRDWPVKSAFRTEIAIKPRIVHVARNSPGVVQRECRLENFAVDDHGMLLAVATCASTARWGFLRALT
jgi:hypothetical protein